MFIFWPYCRGGYRKVEKVAVYHTLLTIGGFIVRIGLDSDCCFFPTSAQQQRQQGHVGMVLCPDAARRDVRRRRRLFAALQAAGLDFGMHHHL
uniref:Uncharacterized protein n=1 Tax=Pyricularia oryzae (strain P131) TaxID=1143193 RepID=L7J6G5_PYRO1